MELANVSTVTSIENDTSSRGGRKTHLVLLERDLDTNFSSNIGFIFVGTESCEILESWGGKICKAYLYH